ncbi:MAG: threonine dehydratase [Hyphomicrobiaceae bacterium]|nr:threonine dehydratase [Hyphomicrobiaceae bacterium]
MLDAFAFTRPDLEAAAALVHERMAPTPAYAWPLVARRAGTEVWIKHENHTPTGAFKIRGGIVYMNELMAGAAGSGLRGVITATRGNHGQSIARAAHAAGLEATILVPHGNSVEKNAAMQAFGARLIEHGRDFDEAKHEAARLAEAEGLHMVPSFHPALVKGVSTYALELFGAAGELDAVYVPIGMGSGICGLMAARDALGLKTEIVGVVAEAAPSVALSFEAGRPVPTNAAATFADGMACREPHPEAVQLICRGAGAVVKVSENEIAEAMRHLFEDTHNIAEGAGAAALAALLKDGRRRRGQRLGAILSGGNVDRPVYAEVLGGGTPRP